LSHIKASTCLLSYAEMRCAVPLDWRSTAIVTGALDVASANGALPSVQCCRAHLRRDAIAGSRVGASMHYLSKVVMMDFKDAVEATRQALKRHHLTILAEIDLHAAMRRHLTADFRPYLVLCACRLSQARQALEADENVGSILFCNVVVQQHGARCIEISTVDPEATIGTINHVDVVALSRELRSMVEHVIDEVELVANCCHGPHQPDAVGQKMQQPKPLKKLATKAPLM
jgi:uncharacterized protein (DUF302 family)